MKHDDELVLKAAWYYYIENMTQQAIASKLEISRMKVIRLLDIARETGVIQFRISQDLGKHLPVEQALREKWNLKNTLIIPTPDDKNHLNESLALAAATTWQTESQRILLSIWDTAIRRHEY